MVFSIGSLFLLQFSIDCHRICLADLYWNSVFCFASSLALTLVGLHAAQSALLLFVLDVAAQPCQSVRGCGEWRLLLRLAITLRFVLDFGCQTAVMRLLRVLRVRVADTLRGRLLLRLFLYFLNFGALILKPDLSEQFKLE